MAVPSDRTVPAPPAGPPGLAPVEQNRLRWRCRRGMLENDLLLTRFLDARAGAISPPEVAALEQLLALPDDRLWAFLSGRASPDEPVDPAVERLLVELRRA